MFLFYIMYPLYDPICILLETPFSRWKIDDKKDFLNTEVPKPFLEIEKQGKSKDKTFVREFRNQWYADYKWLCGSVYLKRNCGLWCVVTDWKERVLCGRMSILYEDEDTLVISHKKYIDSVYEDVGYQIHPDVFNISVPYKLQKPKKQIDVNTATCKAFKELYSEVQFVEDKYAKLKDKSVLNMFCSECKENSNAVALQFLKELHSKKNWLQHSVQNAFGANIGPATVKTIGEDKYLFPKDSTFYSKDISEIHNHLDIKYDLIMLDPPWWNKFIRRKRKMTGDGYQMMYNSDIKSIPIENILQDDGLVVVWCTNSTQHFDCLTTEIFPKWQVTFTGKWFWLKVTTNGEPVCQFSEPPRKQPFEKIIFGFKKPPKNFPNKLLISIPSIIDSHKPPLVEVLKPYLPENPHCLELFARYLLPGWTSYGNEVLKLQHESIYVNKSKL